MSINLWQQVGFSSIYSTDFDNNFFLLFVGIFGKQLEKFGVLFSILKSQRKSQRKNI